MRNFSVATFIAVLRSLLSLPVQEQQHAVDRQVTQQVHGVFLYYRFDQVLLTTAPGWVEPFGLFRFVFRSV